MWDSLSIPSIYVAILIFINVACVAEARQDASIISRGLSPGQTGTTILLPRAMLSTHPSDKAPLARTNRKQVSPEIPGNNIKSDHTIPSDELQTSVSPYKSQAPSASNKIHEQSSSYKRNQASRKRGSKLSFALQRPSRPAFKQSLLRTAQPPTTTKSDAKAGWAIAMDAKRKSRKAVPHAPIHAAWSAITSSHGPALIDLTDQPSIDANVYNVLEPGDAASLLLTSDRQAAAKAAIETPPGRVLIKARGQRVNVDAATRNGQIKFMASGPGLKTAWSNLGPDRRVSIQLRGRPGRPVSVDADLEGYAQTLIVASTVAGDAFHRRYHPQRIVQMKNRRFPPRRLIYQNVNEGRPPPPLSKQRAAVRASKQNLNQGAETGESSDVDKLAEEVKSKATIEDST